VCEAHRRPATRPAAGTHESERPAAALFLDGMEWRRPGTNRRCKALVILNDGSDLVATFVTGSSDVGHPGNFSNETVRKILVERWFQFFGRPRLIQVDPEGAFRALDLKTWTQDQGIEFDLIPAEAHWQNSRVERKIATLRAAADDLAEQVSADVSDEEILGRVCASANELERHNGFSPYQAMLGRSPEALSQFTNLQHNPACSTPRRRMDIRLRPAWTYNDALIRPGSVLRRASGYAARRSHKQRTQSAHTNSAHKQHAHQQHTQTTHTHTLVDAAFEHVTPRTRAHTHHTTTFLFCRSTRVPTTPEVRVLPGSLS
jgi:hypothetical protein